MLPVCQAVALQHFGPGSLLQAGLLHLAHSCGMPHCCRFNSINGMLIPGGSADLKPGHPFYDATEYLFKLALEANDKGDYFPVSHAPHS